MLGLHAAIAVALIAQVQPVQRPISLPALTITETLDCRWDTDGSQWALSISPRTRTVPAGARINWYYRHIPGPSSAGYGADTANPRDWAIGERRSFVVPRGPVATCTATASWPGPLAIRPKTMKEYKR